jgi:uncharacterized damage-inducible protein DinB
MKAIDLFPYWADNRALLRGGLDLLREQDLDVRPAQGLPSVGEILRHIITTEEHWWHGGIHGAPWAEWRPQHWETLADQEKAAYRAARFPTLAAIRDGLEAAHAPVEAFLAGIDADDLCEKRRATWGEENTLRWIVWHLVEHDQHHRALVFTRLRLLGRTAPATFPRPGVMASTPAARWTEPADTLQVVPFWKPLFRSFRAAVAMLSPTDLAYRLVEDLPSNEELVRHVLVEHDRMLRWRDADASGDSAASSDGAPTSGSARLEGAESLAEAIDRALANTNAFLATIDQADLCSTRATAAGPQTLHHRLWYGREHVVHHRAQLFLRLRMLRRTPPAI